MKFKAATAFLALTMSFASFANCALSTNHQLAAELLADKGYEIVEDRSDALFHIQVVDRVEITDASCKLGLCKSQLNKEISVTALTSIDMFAFNLRTTKSKSLIFRKGNAPEIGSNEAEIKEMIDALDEKLKMQYNDCRPL